MAKSSIHKQTLDGILKTYLANIQRGGREGTSEMEVRFGTAKGMKPTTRIEYENVIKRFVSAGFKVSDPQYLLRIGSEYAHPDTGVVKISNIRVELEGIGVISEYCKSNSLEELYEKGKVKFIQKSSQRIKRTRDEVDVVEQYDASKFNFKAALNVENDYTDSRTAKSMVSSWKEKKKEFRYINRHVLTHRDFPLKIDVSIVKQTSKPGRHIERTYSFEDANISSIPEKYELEIEVLNERVGPTTEYYGPSQLAIPVRKAIMMVLSGLQGTNYPISYTEQTEILQEYMGIMMATKDIPRRILPKHFVGPSSIALQINNISKANENSNIPSIRNGYTVTEKADGDRKLLMISNTGKIYLIDTNMLVQFTGAKTSSDELFSTIIDGEHITHNSKGAFINLYAAFDIYYLNGKDIRALDFAATIGEKQEKTRLGLVNSVYSLLRPFGVASRDSPPPIRFEVKTFYLSVNEDTIFNACATIMEKVNMPDRGFEYKTDGLIFTPMFVGVGGTKSGETSKPASKMSWGLSFKWKPPEHNTIDFMVTIQKGSDGSDDIKSVFQSGTDVASALQLTQYKTAALRVGFDESRHGYINPCMNVIDDNLPESGSNDNEDAYKPMRFYPTGPSDDDAGLCNLLLETANGGTTELFTENREVIEDNMIVEFRYNMSKSGRWRWEPLRVRYDKTTELRNGGKNYGNAYHVANSNWHSIHKPITPYMITTGNDIPIEDVDDDVYYNRGSGKRVSSSLRDFHNLYVKKKLIQSVSTRGGTLIDFAVGMGGDFSKWISSRLKFVFGIDVHRDNIENRLNGACARYLNNKKIFSEMPSALFVTGNSSINIKDTSAIATDKGKQITNAVFGKGPKDISELGKGVYKHYGIAEKGFDVASIQFALHYMFENRNTLHNFLRNVSETTKVGGYFIGTCYDGSRVFNELRDKEEGDGVEIHDNDVKMWGIVKKYSQDSFAPDESSLGYSVDVFMESIGKSFTEYLVNFDYLETVIKIYGFALVPRSETHKLGLPSSRGSFRELFTTLTESKQNPKMKSEYGKSCEMTVDEKKISFLNNYFVYKKVHNVDAKSISESMIAHLGEPVQMSEMPPEPVLTAEPSATLPTDKVPHKKLRRKLRLVNE